MARGTQDAAPLEMTKWFDTNYHYLVPELGPDAAFTADSTQQVAELGQALALGLTPRPVLVGLVTYLLLAKPAPGVAADFDPLTLLDRLLPVYAQVLTDLRTAGAEWVQLDEPALVQDRTPAELNAAARAYRDLDALAAVGGLPGRRLVAGVVNGRNIWVNDLEKSLATLGTLLGLADRVDVAASCSLLHVPLDATAERDIEPQILRRLAFARQKTAEIVTLAKGLGGGTDTIAAELAANRADLASRAGSALTHDTAVRARTAAVTATDARRSQPYPERTAAQRAHLWLPLLPTTTIGSFPPRPPNCAPRGRTCARDGSTAPGTRNASGPRSAR
jgi:5-methyltetrahydropteroyltriglutamate--homocysteine methyltransferase